MMDLLSFIMYISTIGITGFFGSLMMYTLEKKTGG